MQAAHTVFNRTPSMESEEVARRNHLPLPPIKEHRDGPSSTEAQPASTRASFFDDDDLPFLSRSFIRFRAFFVRIFRR
ncbi:hypothetical protein Agabi119p4_10202 [Agaricus bisporus var. burnettii]|uniref:Uncharacterized protein n=1 Tax=Agaricus bisporus var. burnettii TaxID=192524 RepID=A0A8H7EW26_AGABI|nr:hypothetical protein Agabi119p4_10202 [Agaricus bisporus var. burnettii]